MMEPPLISAVIEYAKTALTWHCLAPWKEEKWDQGIVDPLIGAHAAVMHLCYAGVTPALVHLHRSLAGFGRQLAYAL